MTLAKDGSSAAKSLISQIQWMSFGAIQSWQIRLNSGAKAKERVYDLGSAAANIGRKMFEDDDDCTCSK